MNLPSEALDKMEYLPPGFFQRMGREIPAFMAMQWGSSFGKPVPLSVDGAGQRVILYPGLAAKPQTMQRMKISLQNANFHVVDWGKGRNTGFREGLLEELAADLAVVASQMPVSLVGWSLGGLVARELAKIAPQYVSRVVTMGSPFSGDVMQNNNAWRTYRLLAGHHAGTVPFAKSLGEKPPVKTIAFWSQKDGVISVGGARGQAHERDHEIEVHCRHMEFASCPKVITQLAHILAV